eukprot:COSAG04_NODE_8588_length_953_cov_2.188525_1_plen_64_part_00
MLQAHCHSDAGSAVANVKAVAVSAAAHAAVAAKGAKKRRGVYGKGAQGRAAQEPAKRKKGGAN